MTTWHLDYELAGRYTGGRVNDVLAASVEQHLVACAACRGLIAATSPVDSLRLETVWADIQERVEAPPVGWIERGLRTLGLSEPTARLLAATPALRGAWLTAVLVVVGLAVVAAHQSERGLAMFMTLAPVLPLLGVAASFGPHADPTLEMAAASPYSLVRLLAVRSAFVIGTGMAPAAVAAAFLPGSGWIAAAWLLPALAMSAVVLATARLAPPNLVALALSALWVGLSAWDAIEGTWVVVEDTLAVQLVSLGVLAAACAGVLALRRDLTPILRRNV
jgi:hypothetical protein